MKMNFSFLIIICILWNNVSGLFLDSMLGSCHGLPFCDQLRPLLNRDHTAEGQDVQSLETGGGYDTVRGQQQQQQQQRLTNYNTINQPMSQRLDGYNVMNGRPPQRLNSFNPQNGRLPLQLQNYKRPQQHQQPSGSYNTMGGHQPQLVETYSSSTKGRQQQLVQGQGHIPQVVGNTQSGGSPGSNIPVSTYGQTSSNHDSLRSDVFGRSGDNSGNSGRFQISSQSRGTQSVGGPFSGVGPHMSPYSMAGGNGGQLGSPFSHAQVENTGIATPGQMFSSVLHQGSPLVMGPAAGMGNQGGQANNFFLPQAAQNTGSQSIDASVVFGDIDEVQYLNGKIVIPKSWALNHLAKVIQKQQEVQGKTPGESTFGCPDFPRKCPKKFTFLDNNGCPICTYMPQEVKSPTTANPTTPRRPNVCMMPTMSEGPCGTFEQRYAYDREVKRCRLYVENACGDLKNKFGSLHECQYVCERGSPAQDTQGSGNPMSWYDNIWNR